MKTIKKVRKYHINFKYLSIICIFLIIFSSIICFGVKSNYILKVNNEYISKDEFLLYFFEQQRAFEEIGGLDIWQTDFSGTSAKEVARSNTIDSIIYLKSSISKQKQFGIKLTKGEKHQLYEDAEIFKENIEKSEKNINIPMYIYKKFIKENLIEKKVYSYITDNFVINEKDFKDYLKKYVKENINKLKNIKLDYIFIENNDTFDAFQKSQEISQYVNINTDFRTIAQAPFIKVFLHINLEKDMFEENIQEQIYTLSENSISNVIQSRDGFYIFKIDKITQQDKEEIIKTAKDEYTILQKDKLYNSQLKSWVNDIKIKINNKNLSQINL